MKNENEIVSNDDSKIGFDSLLSTVFIDKNLLKQAIEKWGANAQVEMIEEECLELSLAIHKLRRKRGDMATKVSNVIDEIADVTIMMHQAFELFPSDLIQDRIKFKMERLEERLKEGIG